jgi:hypothetical protein
MSEQTQAQLAETAAEHGGLVWAIDAMQPEGHGTLLYVLYEVLGLTPVAAIPLEGATAEELCKWLKPYQELPYPVLATLSDGEKTIIAALKQCWPDAPHQRCQAHLLNNLAEPVLTFDTQLRQQMRADLGGLPPVSERTEMDVAGDSPEQPEAAPLFVTRKRPT